MYVCENIYLIMNISISTAHNVDIDYIPAGVLDRILATLIDGAFQFGYSCWVSCLSAFSAWQTPRLGFRHSCGDHRFLPSILRGSL